MLVKKEKDELIKELPLWIERVLKYARLTDLLSKKLWRHMTMRRIMSLQVC